MFIIKNLGFIQAILSASIFGAMPFFTKILSSYGSDVISSGIYRMSLSLIFIFLWSKLYLKYDMKISKKEFVHLILYTLGFAFTVITLFTSYDYISSSAATSIHFLYPIIIFIISIIIKKEKPNNIEIFCIVLASIGLIFITDFKQMSNAYGIIYAVISAFTYSFYSIFLENSNVLKKMPTFKILFYSNFFGCIMLFFYTTLRGKKIYLDFTLNQWVVVFIYSFVLTVGATFLYQKAIVNVGAKYTSMLSILEPIVSIVLGFLLLSERMNILQILSAICILISNFVLVKVKK